MELDRTTQSLIDQANGDFTVMVNLIADEIQRREENTPASNTITARKERYDTALAELDQTMLLEMQEIFSDFIDLIHTNQLDVNTTSLTPEQAQGLMAEMQSFQRISEFAAVRKDQVRQVVFNTITEANRAAGEDHPEHVNGEIEVPVLGKKFTKEGAGQKAPLVDQTLLQELLGEDIWDEVCDHTHIPAHFVEARTERSLNLDLLMKLVAEQPQLMSKLEQCIQPGPWKSPSFRFDRDIK